MGGFALSFLIYNKVIAAVNVGSAAIVLNLIPAFGLLSSLVFLGEEPTRSGTVGACLIGGSVIYFTICHSRAIEPDLSSAGPGEGAGRDRVARRERPALTEHPHPAGTRLGAMSAEPAGGPGEHPGLTGPQHGARSGRKRRCRQGASLGRPGHGTVPNVSAEALCACFHKPFPRRSGEQHRNFRSAYRAPASA